MHPLMKLKTFPEDCLPIMVTTIHHAGTVNQGDLLRRMAKIIMRLVRERRVEIDLKVMKRTDLLRKWTEEVGGVEGRIKDKGYKGRGRWVVKDPYRKWVIEDVEEFVNGSERTMGIKGEIMGDGFEGRMGTGKRIYTEVDYAVEEVERVAGKVGRAVEGMGDVVEDWMEGVRRECLRGRRRMIELLIGHLELKKVEKVVEGLRQGVAEERERGRRREEKRREEGERRRGVLGKRKEREWMEGWVKRVREGEKKRREEEGTT